ncbi:hypothetical protein FRC03_008543 [Tulasnella sp. 419]|nr:hypothetical protein FRC03_008543 [Tulasnella sp. 419]
MLPLHAAGPHRKNKPNLPDIYVSSYTPSLSAMLRSYPSRLPSIRIPSLLVVAQPEAKGENEIPSVREELRRIQRTVPSVDLLLNEEGTFSAVTAGLRTHSWVHFASHGSQNAKDPFDSCFHLHDSKLTLRDIIHARLPDAQFAFLAACHSAAGDIGKPDETIHMAAGLQFCGFRSVIGTMYAMADLDGPALVEEVYKQIFHHSTEVEDHNGVTADCRDAANALNMATKTLKDKGIPVERWINFVHIGV